MNNYGLPQKLISIGIKEFDRKLVNKHIIIKRKDNKPPTGFWCAPYVKNKISSWFELVNNQIKNDTKCCDLYALKWYSTDSVILNIKDEAKWYVINSKNDLKKLFEDEEIGFEYYDIYNFKDMFFSEIYEVTKANMKLEYFYKNMKNINWKNFKKKYDILYLTEKGYIETDFKLNTKNGIEDIKNEKYLNTLYDWNCECCVIFNENIIENWEYKKIEQEM